MIVPFQDYFDSSESSAVLYRISIAISAGKKITGIFIGIALSLQIALISMDILTVLIVQIHECEKSFHLFMSSHPFISVLLFSYAKLLHPWLNLFLSSLSFWIQILAAYFFISFSDNHY